MNKTIGIGTQVFELGKQAFNDGKVCEPLLDRNLVPLLPINAPMGARLALMKKWATGWHTSRMASTTKRSMEKRNAAN